jgi:hypothetical protein
MTPSQKLGHWGLVLADKTQGVLDLDWGNVTGEGYTGVEGLGGGEQAVCKGGVDLGSLPKTVHQRLVLVNKMWGVLEPNWVDEGGEVYTGD